MSPRSPCAVSRPVDEFELIRRYFVRAGEGEGVITGIGDDGAVLRPGPGKEFVTVIDTLVEGTHFPDKISAADLGYRAVAVNLSDIAAMAARPLWMTLALTMPPMSNEWIESFARGLFAAADEHRVALVGGDTTAGAAIVVSVQVTGDVEEGKALLRSGARPGDTIYVTGTLGDAAAGLSMIGSGNADEYLLRRFLRPQARIGVGLELAACANSCIDVSDGLVGDLRKLLDASEAGADLNLDALPLSAALVRAFDEDVGRRFAATGGDDYELCFTSSQPLPGMLAGVPVTAIGTVNDSNDLVCRSGGAVVEIDDSGYRHF